MKQELKSTPSGSLPKPPGKSHWELRGGHYLLMLGEQKLGELTPPEQEKGAWRVWARTPGGPEGVSDSTGTFDDFEEAVEALVEHVEEMGTAGASASKKGDSLDKLLAELVHEIRVRSTAIGALCVTSSACSLVAYFWHSGIFLGAGSSLALAAGMMALLWWAEAGMKDG